MQLSFAIKGQLSEYLKENLREAKKAVTTGVSLAGDGLKKEMRTQIAKANLGKRLSNSWRCNIYPKKKDSLNAAANVYTGAHRILMNFEQGSVIRGKTGLWLAIPTPNVHRYKGKRSPTPAEVERALGVTLRFVYRVGAPSLLVLDNRRASYNRKTGQLRGFNKASASALRTGKGLATVVMFWLVPQVKMPKKLDFKGASLHWYEQIPRLITENWKGLT